MSFTMNFNKLASLFAVSCLWVTTVWANDNLHIPGNYQETGFGEQREYQKGQANEYIDPFGGGLKRIYTDYVFPNNGGMDITITRIYNTLQNAHTGQDHTINLNQGKWANASGGKATMGPGWDIHFGRIWLPLESGLVPGSPSALAGRVIPAWKEYFDENPNNPGEDKTEWSMEECHISQWASGGYANQLPVLELPDGSREVLYPTLLLDNPSVPLYGRESAYMTKNHWIATCLPYDEEIDSNDGGFIPHSQGGLVLYSPAGLRYVFNKKGALTGFGSTWGQGRQEGYVVTKISDLNGNTMNINYVRAPLDEDSILRPASITTTSDLDSVTVDFNYTTGSGLLNSISGQGAIIDYTHDEHQLLKKVSIVTGGTGDEMLEWEYEYVPANATPPAPQHDAPFNLSKVTSPTGQITTYGYDIQPFTVCPLINNQPCPSALMDRHSNVVVKTRTVDGVVWDYDYSPGDASNPNPNDITTVTASAGGKTLCTSYEHIGEAATLGVIDANTQLVLNRNLHRRGLLVEKKIYAGECSASGSDLMQTETLEYNKKAYITNLDDYRPYPATRDTRVWVPLLTKKTINRRNDKERVTEYSYFGGDYDKDAYQDNTDHWKGLFFLTNPVKSTKEIVDEQVDKATQLLTSSTFNKAGGLSPSPVLTYKVSEAGWEVIDSGVKFSNFKYFNSANGNLDATLDHGVITLYEYWTNGDIKKLVTMKNAADIGCIDASFPNAMLTCIQQITTGLTLFEDYKAGVPGKITLPDGTAIVRVLDDRGNVTSETISKNGEFDTVTGYSYDLLNRVKTVTTPRSDDANVAIAYPSFTETVLTRGRFTKSVIKNTRGLVVLSCASASDAESSLCQNFTYDPLQNWKLFASDVSYSETEAQGTQTAYDVLGRITSTGHTGKAPVTYFYDVEDQVRSVQKVNGVDAVTRSTYRAYGNPDDKFLIKIEQQEVDSSYITTEMVKNSMGRLASVTQDGRLRTFSYLGGFPLWMNWEENEYQNIVYCYGYGGKVVEIYKGQDTVPGVCNITSEDDLTQRMSYDVMNRVRWSSYFAFGDALKARSQYFTYDKLGNLKTASLDAVFGLNDARNTWQYDYDLNNNLKSETFTNHEDAPVAAYNIDYKYDDLDVLEQITYPNNQKAIYSPDGLGRATKLDYVNGVDTTELVKASDLNYFADGSVRTLTLGNNKSVINTQTVDKMLDAVGVSDNVLSLDYDYDDVGNVTGVAGTNDLMESISKTDLQYDGLSRLKSVILPNGAYSYSYNPSGGITNKKTPVGDCTYSYNSTTALLTEISGDCGEVASAVQYDSLKNIRGKNGYKAYTYNSANQLIRQDGVFYAEYDANGHRFRAVTPQQRGGAGGTINAPYLNLFGKSGKNLVEIDHLVDGANGYAKKNYRNHVYFGSMHFSNDDCDAKDTGMPDGKNYALGICADADDDQDGFTYQQELDMGTYPFDDDSDNDGLSESQEQVLGTNPLLADTDRDGLTDGYENANGYNPLQDLEGAQDFDDDGLTNNAELLHHTHPLRADTDVDTLPDGWEVAQGRNPVLADYQLDIANYTVCSLGDTGLDCLSTNDELYQQVVPELNQPVQVSVSDSHACALDVLTGVHCWGSNGDGESTVPPLINPKAISVTESRSCALDDVGIRCWGRGADTQNIPPMVNPVALSIGDKNSCAIDMAGVKCWGEDKWVIPPMSNPVSVSVGLRHACALDDVGVHCWTNDNSGGSASVPLLTNPRAVSVGESHSCALDDVGVHCWGYNQTGAATIPALFNPVQVVAGPYRTCALDDQGWHCWGNQGRDYLTAVPVMIIDADDDSLNRENEIALGASDLNANTDGDAALDNADTCPAIANNQALDDDVDGIGNACDDDNDNDDLTDTQESTLGTNPLLSDSDGDGLSDEWEARHDFKPLNTIDALQDGDHDGLSNAAEFLKGTNPRRVDTDFDTLPDAGDHDPLQADYQVVAGYRHTCALDDSGLKCWGDTDYGINTVPPLIDPMQFDGGDYVNVFCAVDDNGVTCWGDDAATLNSFQPALFNPVQVSVGSSFACALDDSGVKCWGKPGMYDNPEGAIHVPRLSNPRQISAGYRTVCALDDSGVKCWGSNGWGQLDVPSLTNPVQVTVGTTFVCALDDAGVHCWGKVGNVVGQLPVPALENPVTVSAGGLQICAVHDAGVRCWEPDNAEQVSDLQLDNPVAVSASAFGACALDDAGVVCWGSNGWDAQAALIFDYDDDGLSNAKELVAGADRFNPDSDGDGLSDGMDKCSMLFGADQPDSDDDGYGNACDAFPNNPAEYLDTDGDGEGNNIDSDDDNDSVLDANDELPLVKGIYPGQLDFSFDADGMQFTPLVSGLDKVNAILQQADGKLVAVGVAHNGSNNDFALARYNLNGSLDASFNGTGKVITAVGSGNDVATAVLQQTDGKLVLAGYSRSGNYDFFALVRYNSNGSLDTSFDVDGKLTTSIATNKHSYANAIVQQADGKLVAAGYYFTSGTTSSTADIAVARYLASGALDTTFDVDGKLTTAIGIGADIAKAIIEADGKLVVAGFSKVGEKDNFALLRYCEAAGPGCSAAGALDSTFGVDGKQTTSILPEQNAYANAIVRQADGSLVAAGYSGTDYGSGNEFVLVRYCVAVGDGCTAIGALDTTFDSDGIAIAGLDSYVSDKAAGVIQQSDGKLVVAGSSGDNKMTLIRFASDGTLDAAFDNDGIVTTILPNSAAANALIKQADGKLVVAGYSNDGSNDDFALLRYHANLDTDSDGLSDEQEIISATDKLSVDSDGDGLSDSDEITSGATPWLADTDGDELSDGLEVANGTSPTVPDDSFLVNVLAHRVNFSMDKAWLLAMAQPPGLNAATLDVDSVSNIGGYSHGAMTYNTATGQLVYSYSPANSGMFSATLSDSTAATRKGIIAITMLPVGADLSLYAAANQQIVVDDTFDGGVYGGGAADDILLDGLGNDAMMFGVGSGDDLAYFDDATLGRTDTLNFGAGIGKDDVRWAAQGDDLVANLSQMGTPTGDTLTLIDYAQDVYRHAMNQMVIGGAATGYAAVDDVIVQAQDACVATTIDTVTPANSVLAWQGISPAEMLRNDFNATKTPLILNTMALAGTSSNVIGAPDYVDNWGFVSLSLLLQDSCLPSGMSYRVANHESASAGEGHRGYVEVYPIAPAANIEGSTINRDRNESLYGLDDTVEAMIGHGGNDRLYSGNGPDAIVFNLGDERDTVDLQGELGGGDTLSLGAGILPATTTIVRDGLDLLVQPSTVDQVRLQGYFANDQWTMAGFAPTGAMNFNQISFSGGTSWARADVEAKIQTAEPCVNPVDCADNNAFVGTVGNDVVFGWAGNDDLSGGSGDDQLIGDAGDDMLNPGPGKNWLSGGAGADTYVLDAGSGTTTIENFDLTTGQAHYDFTGNTAGRDRILFPSHVQDSHVQLLRENADLVVIVTDGTNTSVTNVLGFFVDYGFSNLDIFFAGTNVTWDPDCIDFSGTLNCIANRTLTDALLDDGVSAQLADDNLVFDYSYGGATSIYGGLGNDYIKSAGADDTLYGEDGNDVLDSGDGADTLYGGNGNDTISGGWGDNTLFGEAGNDTLIAIGPFGSSVLNGGAGDDIYRLADDAAVTVQTQAAAGDSGKDTVQFTGSLQADQLWMQAQGNNLLIHELGSTRQFVVEGWNLSGSQLDRIQAGSCSITRASLESLVTATAGTEPTPVQNAAFVTAYWACP